MPPARKPKLVVPTSNSASTSSSLASPLPGPSSSSAHRYSTASDITSATMTAPSADQLHHNADEGQWTEPPWVGFLETTEDALLILEAARRRMIPRVTRRLADRERRLIQSGSVFVFEEEESGIKRWTDGFLWSPSRILGNFLLYRETDKRNADGTPATRPGRSSTTSSSTGASSLLVAEEPSYTTAALRGLKPEDMGAGGFSAAGSSGLARDIERKLLGSLTNSQKFKEDGMMKKTFSLTLPNSTTTHHIVSYYKVSDVEAGRLRTPSSLPEFMALEISPEFLDKTHFRVQPRVEVGEDGRVRFRGETTDEPDSPKTSAAEAPSNSHSHPSSHHANNVGHHPYPRPHHGSHSRQSSTAGAEFLAAAKAQAEASARMYMNGAAKAYQQAPVGVGSNGTTVGSQASSLGLHYPSALTSPTDIASSTTTMSSPVSYCGSNSSYYSSPPPTAKPQHVCYYSTDNSTGAPAFQAPQLYNPSQPSAAANATFSTSTYPASLAPSVRSSASVYSTTNSVRSASMSVSTGMDDEYYGGARPSRSGSGSSSAGSLTMASSATSSEVATPSIASSRRSSTGYSRPDAHALKQALAQTKAEMQSQQHLPESFSADLSMMNLDMFAANNAPQSYFNVPIVDDLTTNPAAASTDFSYDPYTYSPSHTQASSFGGFVESPQNYFPPTAASYSIPPPAQKSVYQQQQQQQQQQQVWYDTTQFNGYGGAFETS